MKLFVYGSLKPGGWSHHLIEDVVVSEGVQGTVTGSIYDVGNFPALKRDDKGVVHGLLYEVKDDEKQALLVRLDRLEGYPGLFDRGYVAVTTGKCVEHALLYFGADQSMFDEEQRIESGFWDV